MKIKKKKKKLDPKCWYYYNIFSVILQRYMTADSEEHRHLFDLIEKMLDYDPAQRLDLRTAMRHPYFDKLTPEQRGERPTGLASGGTGDSRDRSHSISR